jgi:hypothetical protein
VRRPPGPRAPKPADLAPTLGPNEFDADQEQAMRAGPRQANMAPPAGEPDGDEGMGGLGGDVMARVELELGCNTHFAYTTKSCKVSS